MAMKLYDWAVGAGIQTDPQVVGEKLEALDKKHGRLTPAIVVNDAQSPFSPLHDAFEWDDSKAAEQYRLGQADHLLRSIVVVERHAPRAAYQSVSIGRGGKKSSESFVNVARLSDHEKRRRALETALNELERWASQYAQYEELAPITEAIEHTREAIRQHAALAA